MRRHPFDLASLLTGLVFLGVAATYLLGAATGNDIDSTWVLPVTLVALGLAGLTGGIVRATHRTPNLGDTRNTPAPDPGQQ